MRCYDLNLWDFLTWKLEIYLGCFFWLMKNKKWATKRPLSTNLWRLWVLRWTPLLYTMFGMSYDIYIVKAVLRNVQSEHKMLLKMAPPVLLYLFEKNLEVENLQKTVKCICVLHLASFIPKCLQNFVLFLFQKLDFFSIIFSL